MTDWQEISTAPKDGTRFLAHATDAVPGWNPYFCDWSDEYKCWWPATPTHWMPLPSPPKPEKIAAKLLDESYPGGGMLWNLRKDAAATIAEKDAEIERLRAQECDTAEMFDELRATIARLREALEKIANDTGPGVLDYKSFARAALKDNGDG